MPTFTLNILESASLEVSLTLREDTLKPTFYHLFISHVNWKTFLSSNREYRVSIPVTFKTDPTISPYAVATDSTYLNSSDVSAFAGSNYTTNGAIIPTSEAAGSVYISLTGDGSTADYPFRAPKVSAYTAGTANLLDGSARGDTGGNILVTSGVPEKGTYLGTFRGSADAVKVHTKCILQERTGSGGWNTIAEDDGSVTTALYKFTWDDGNGAKNYDVEIYHDPVVANHPNLPKLYTNISGAVGQSINIGYHTYLAYADTIPTKFKVGSTAQFSLHIPKDETGDMAVATAEVDDFDSISIPVHTRDLFSFGLQKEKAVSTSYSGGTVGTTSGTGTSAVGGVNGNANADNYTRSTIRNSSLCYFAPNAWPEVWIRSVKWQKAPNAGPDTQTDVIGTKSFSLHGQETTFTVGKIDAVNLRFLIETGLGTAKRTVLEDVEIVPFIPGVSQSAPPPTVHLVPNA